MENKNIENGLSASEKAIEICKDFNDYIQKMMSKLNEKQKELYEIREKYLNNYPHNFFNLKTNDIPQEIYETILKRFDRKKIVFTDDGDLYYPSYASNISYDVNCVHYTNYKRILLNLNLSNKFYDIDCTFIGDIEGEYDHTEWEINEV